VLSCACKAIVTALSHLLVDGKLSRECLADSWESHLLELEGTVENTQIKVTIN
jgi:hypothetical protein